MLVNVYCPASSEKKLEEVDCFSEQWRTISVLENPVKVSCGLVIEKVELVTKCSSEFQMFKVSEQMIESRWQDSLIVSVAFVDEMEGRSVNHSIPVMRFEMLDSRTVSLIKSICLFEIETFNSSDMTRKIETLTVITMRVVRDDNPVEQMERQLLVPWFDEQNSVQELIESPPQNRASQAKKVIESDVEIDVTRSFSEEVENGSRCNYP